MWTCSCNAIEDMAKQLGYEKQIFACQESDGVWRLYVEADFILLDPTSYHRSIQLLLGEEDTQAMSSQCSAALDVKIPDPRVALALRRNGSDCGSDCNDDSDSATVTETRKELIHGGSGKCEGTFIGEGEKLGEWDSYIWFEAEKESSRPSLFARDLLVTLFGVDHRVVLVRILGSQKKGAGGKMQACYVCLLYDDGAPRGRKWLYATMPHVHPTYKLQAADSRLMNKISNELASFTPTTASGATQQAAKYAPPKPAKEGAKKRKAA